jgi:small subunit ribosomal protein S16
VAVRLRLMRTGRSGQATYRIVAVDGRKRRDGACIEKIGHYNPRTAPPELVIDEAKALKWLKQGASPSDTVRSLLSRQGLLLGWDLQKKGASQDEIQMKVAEFRGTKEAGLIGKAKAAQEAAAKKKKPAAAVEAVEAAAPIPAPEPERSSEKSAEPEGTT